MTVLYAVFLFPLLLFFRSASGSLLRQDVARYSWKRYRGNTCLKMISLARGHMGFRAVLLYRLHGHKLLSKYTRLFFRAPCSVEIKGEIGGGLYLPHAIGIISVYTAGENVSVMPGVVMGKKGTGDRRDTNATVGDHVTICANATVFGGISIGDHATIGAGAVVTRSVSPYTIVAGNPAKIVKRYDHGKKQWIRADEEL